MSWNYPPGVTGNEPYLRGPTEEEEEEMLEDEFGISTLRFPNPVKRVHIRICNADRDVFSHYAEYDPVYNTIEIVLGDLSGHIKE